MYAIDHEYQTLIHHGTCTNVPQSTSALPVPFEWVFRAKKIDEEGNYLLFKGRYTLRGDLQEPGIDYDPDSL